MWQLHRTEVFAGRRRIGQGALRRLALVLWAGAVSLLVVIARAYGADPSLEDALRGLTSEDERAVDESAARLVASPNASSALPALEALCDERLRSAPDGSLFYTDEKGQVRRAITGAVAAAPADAKAVEMNNALRRVVLPLVARLRLGSPDVNVRLAAASELAKRGGADGAPLLRAALEREKDREVRDAIAVALARMDLSSTERATKLEALEILRRLGDGSLKADLAPLAQDSDATIRGAALAALRSIEGRERVVSFVGDLVHGVSLASVLLFAALGLAITFGLMGVINMAHGEMLMIGAYTTYCVQLLFEKYAPGAFGAYLFVAVPLAFAVTTVVGIGLERAVIRHLYGRQLETLLATWGISLILIQTVRLVFGAQNVSVANPQWLAGGVEVAHGLVLPYSRIAVVVFVVVVALAVWALLSHTKLGLLVRAVTQNRAMAACLGVPTSRVDMWIFGLGCGIAGLGGVALSQLGNVGPELGQGYIIDSFMVVVLGGVGRLAGSVAAALGLGIINKLLEPFAGAVLGKIAILLLVILFIQRRPQGLFALKGRVET
jgi:urea transport system permease protein